jgi:hypothetical protein
VVVQPSVVGMEHRRPAELGAEVFGVGAERLGGFAHAVEEGLVDHALVMPGAGPQLVGQGEGHEKVLHREELGLLALQPLGRVVVLALGTAARSTGQRPPLVVATLRTVLYVNGARIRGTAGEYGPQGRVVARQEARAVFRQEGVGVFAKDGGQFHDPIVRSST